MRASIVFELRSARFWQNCQFFFFPLMVFPFLSVRLRTLQALGCLLFASPLGEPPPRPSRHFFRRLNSVLRVLVFYTCRTALDPPLFIFSLTTGLFDPQPLSSLYLSEHLLANRRFVKSALFLPSIWLALHFVPLDSTF